MASVARHWNSKHRLLGPKGSSCWEIPNPYRKHELRKHEKQKGMVNRMRNPKLIVHESYSGKRRPEEIFAAIFLSADNGLTIMEKMNTINLTEQSQDSLCSKEGETNGTSEE